MDLREVGTSQFWKVEQVSDLSTLCLHADDDLFVKVPSLPLSRHDVACSSFPPMPII